MRVLGLDIGDRYIGVALSDPLRLVAQGLPTVKRSDDSKDIAVLMDIISTREVELIVAGFPKNMDGSLGTQSEKVMAFADKLSEIAGIPVKYWDERLTTVAANKLMLEWDYSRKKRKDKVDQMAAILILQGYLDNEK